MRNEAMRLPDQKAFLIRWRDQHNHKRSLVVKTEEEAEAWAKKKEAEGCKEVRTYECLI